MREGGTGGEGRVVHCPCTTRCGKGSSSTACYIDV